MGRANTSFDVACDNELVIHCGGCERALEAEKIAMLHRKESGGVFFSMCVDCFHTMVYAALATFAAQEIAIQLTS